MDVENLIITTLKDKVKGLTGNEMDIRLDEPPAINMGDYSTNISFRLAKDLKKAPKMIAEDIANSLSILGIERIEAVNGYINFFMNYSDFSKETVSKISDEKENFGKLEKRNEKVILEHTSANPNGPFHIGHGRNMVIGDSLKRILIASGYDVETQYYVNDMGRQEAIVVFGNEKFELDNSKKADHAIGEVYVETNKLLAENEELEQEILNLMKNYESACEAGIENELTEKFKNAVNYSLGGFKETLLTLNIYHDKFVWESEFVKSGMVREVINRLMNTGKVVEDEVYRLDLSDYGIEKKLVLARLNGTSLYSTRDIAYHITKMENCDFAVNLLGADHKLTAVMVNKTLALLGYNEAEVVFYEFISLPEGSMSTRKGRFISMDELFEEAKSRAAEEVRKRGVAQSEEEIEEIAKKIAVGAVRYNIVRIAPEKPMVFRWDEALDFEKVGCPVIQYAHARCSRILENVENISNENLFAYDMNENEKTIVKLLSKLPKIVEKAAEVRKPQIVANYVLDVAQGFNKFYANCPVLKEENETVKNSRLAIVSTTKTVLENTLDLLGIEMPGKM
ncbi:arginine--tRNA ligase [Methanococcus maripaludis]|uniref:Arginine--tRNA ligase n=1 Tax=Methanococcus maripaludis (strain DSM 14266 / JCM 13030 / NBRC 101832 / S2 / LL) TaxID=267377 RepID=SYR_METMP|nr:arginine--tRNA ligase [Methanococcus maripaludis]Q6LYG5.1 RecName: Full=Arginine--tRNA ligase; AltName: Full=Arginyl-tRNA synthetase; Short=ArgRS [Methanococcus maripaludis S2]CAF30582.1 Arginyl-tRNA synthetase [Methanococcus maripaludis S2]